MFSPYPPDEESDGNQKKIWKYAADSAKELIHMLGFSERIYGISLSFWSHASPIHFYMSVHLHTVSLCVQFPSFILSLWHLKAAHVTSIAMMHRLFRTVTSCAHTLSTWQSPCLQYLSHCYYCTSILYYTRPYTTTEVHWWIWSHGQSLKRNWLKRDSMSFQNKFCSLYHKGVCWRGKVESISRHKSVLINSSFQRTYVRERHILMLKKQQTNDRYP